MPLDVSRQVPRDCALNMTECLVHHCMYMSGTDVGLLKIKNQRQIKVQKLR